MFVPTGYTEEEVLDIIKQVLNQLCSAFRFGYYDVDDMRQEGYIYALEALPNYKSKMSSLKTFMYNHIRNRFINMRRNKLERNVPPCSTCLFFSDDEGCKADHNKPYEKCPRLLGWEARNQSKKNLMEASIYDNDDCVTTDSNVLKDLMIQESLEILDRYMPIELRADYHRLLDGMVVPKLRRNRVYEAARRILKIEMETDNG